MLRITLFALISLSLCLAGCDREEESPPSPSEPSSEPSELTKALSPGRVTPESEVPTEQPGGAVTLPAPESPRPMPLAPGQWTRHRMTTADGSTSDFSYKVVGQEEDATWLEVESETPSGRLGLKLLIAFGDRSETAEVEIRAVRVRSPNGTVQGFEGPMLSSAQRLYKVWVDNLTVSWDGLEQADVSTVAGRFSQAYQRQAESGPGPFQSGGTIWHHPSVPVTGMVRMQTEDGNTVDLVAFGETGATSSFE